MPDNVRVERSAELDVLVDRATRGDRVILTREGVPVAELTPLVAETRRITPGDLDWLESHRVPLRKPARQHAGQLLSSIRDETGR